MFNQIENLNDIILIIKYMLNIKKFQICLVMFLIYFIELKFIVLILFLVSRVNNLILFVLELNVVKNSNKVI